PTARPGRDGRAPRPGERAVRRQHPHLRGRGGRADGARCRQVAGSRAGLTPGQPGVPRPGPSARASWALVGWEDVDEGWGHGAVDYAYLFEAQMWREYVELLDAGAVGPGTRLLDVGCGSGFALRLAAERGAVVAGIDASPRLLAVARARTP